MTVDIFGGAAAAFGRLLSTDPATGGFILGLIVVICLGFTLLILASVFLDAHFDGLAIVVPFIPGFIFVSLVSNGVGGTWWPLWVPILVLVICAVVILKPFGGGGGGEP